MISVGSDFSGVGAFDQALRRLNIEYKTIFACDMDKYARQSYIANYGEPKYYPDNVYNREIPKEPLDIFMTSPPCQSFSLAGKRKGEDSVNGVLFYNSHEFIVKNKPRYFIFENVKGLLSDAGGKTFQNWIDLLAGKSVNGNPVLFPNDESTPYHVYYKVLNAKNFGVPQNRERIFIVGIRDDADNNFTWPKEFPLEKRLKDVLETNVDEKYFLSDDNVAALQVYNQRQLYNGCGFSAKFRDIEEVEIMDTLKVGGGGKDDLIKVRSATSKGYEVANEGDSINLSQMSSETKRGRVGKQVAQTLDTACNQSVVIGAFRGRNPDNPSSRKAGDKFEQTLELNTQGTSNTLTSVQKDNVVVYKEPFILGYTRDEKGIVTKRNPLKCSNTIHTGTGGGGNTDQFAVVNYKIRKLTPRECFRLMDFPDTFEFVVSNSQLYKQAGNSIVVNVLASIISKLRLV